MGYVAIKTDGVIYFQECDWCGHLHPENWDGECLDKTERYSEEELNAKLGENGWRLLVFAEIKWVPEDEFEGENPPPHEYANAA